MTATTPCPTRKGASRTCSCDAAGPSSRDAAARPTCADRARGVGRLGHHPGLLIVFSTSTPFEATSAAAPRGYGPFAVYTILEHGGDWSAAAAALRRGQGAASPPGSFVNGDRVGEPGGEPPDDGAGDGPEQQGAEPPAEDPPEPDDPGSDDEAPDDEDPTRGGAAPVFARLGARWLRDVPHAPPPELLLDRLDAEEDTVLFGAGDTGKGVRGRSAVGQAAIVSERYLLSNSAGLR